MLTPMEAIWLINVDTQVTADRAVVSIDAALEKLSSDPAALVEVRGLLIALRTLIEDNADRAQDTANNYGAGSYDPTEAEALLARSIKGPT